MNLFAKVCMKRGQATRQLHAAEREVPEDTDRSDTEAHIYTAESIGAVQGHGKKWFANLKMNGGFQRCQVDSGQSMQSMGIFHTECVVRGKSTSYSLK